VAFIPEDKSFTQQKGDSTTPQIPQISSVLNNTKFNISELVRVIGVINEYNQKREIKIRHMGKYV